MIGGEGTLKDEQVIDLLMDIQSRLGRIEERMSRLNGIEAKADESLRISRETKERTDDVASRVEQLETQKEWTRKTIIGAVISAAIALVSAVLPYFGGN